MLFAVVLAAPASATKPLDVEIDLTTYFAEPPALASGTFEASGPAVEAGLMCSEGTKQDLFPEKWAGSSSIVQNGQVITEFTCTDEPFAGDTFVIKAQMHIDISAGPPTWVVNWVVKGGTGAFTDLHGNGAGSGNLIFDPFPVGAADLYSGQLH
ncbi:MAG: hypothetical protein OEM96_10110 [Gemmatimonadota bacterium]|nr:hypothetical protein [Gemmatimonadota bacterium]